MMSTHITLYISLLILVLISECCATGEAATNKTQIAKAMKQEANSTGSKPPKAGSATEGAIKFVREPQFLRKNVYPTGVTPPIPSRYSMVDELRAWSEIAAFGALIERFPTLNAVLRNSSETYLVFAPTLGALFKFCDDVVHIIVKEQERRRHVEMAKNSTTGHVNGTKDGAKKNTKKTPTTTQRVQRLARIMGSTMSQFGEVATSNRREEMTMPSSSCSSTPVVRMDESMGNATEIVEWMKLVNRTVDDFLNAIMTITAARDLFEVVLKNHIAVGSFPEPRITFQNFKRIAMLSGEWVDTSEYPKRIRTTPNGKQTGNLVVEATRLYRQLKVSNGYLVFVDHVLWPVSMASSLATISSHMPKPFVVPAVPPALLAKFASSNASRVMETPEPRAAAEASHEPDMFDELLSDGKNRSLLSVLPKLPKIPPFMPFSGMTVLVNFRQDLSIFNFLLTMASKTGVIMEQLAVHASYHMLAPTNNAFFGIARMALGSTMKDTNLTYVDSLLHKMTTNVTHMEQFADRLLLLWANVTTLPSLLEVLLYHVVFSPHSYDTLVKNGTARVLSLKKQPVMLNFSAQGIEDADRGRPPAKPIASFATLNGYLTVIDGLLTPFDLRIALSVIAAALQEEDDDGRTTSKKPRDAVSNMASGLCFPGSAVVKVKGGHAVAMHSLKAGDEVHTGASGESTSVVFAFSHRMADALSDDFVTLVFANRSKEITLSGGHYIYANGVLTAACQVRVLDMLRMHDGRPVAVDEIRYGVRNVGLYAPHSYHGDLVVDDVVVSSYSVAVHPRLAHWLLAPVRAFARSFGVVEPLGSLLYLGGGRLTDWLPKGSLRY